MAIEKEYTPAEQRLYNSINSLIEIAPSNWAASLAERMGCKEPTVRHIANGVRGRRTYKPLTLLEELKKIVKEYEQRIDDGINS